MTQDEALSVLRKQGLPRSIIRDLCMPFGSIAQSMSVAFSVDVYDDCGYVIKKHMIKICVDERMVKSWFDGKRVPTRVEYQRLCQLLVEKRKFSKEEIKENERLMSMAFRHEYIPSDVLNGKETDDTVLFLFGVK